jgi:histidine triad (HIT) family protein
MKAFNADGITLQQFSEHAGGQVVFHLHVTSCRGSKASRCSPRPAARKTSRCWKIMPRG